MDYEIDVPSRGEIVHELEMIVEEFSLGSALKERALFRIWRIWRNASYLQILDDSPSALKGEPKYHTWSEFLKDFVMPSGISKSTVYSRMKAYSILEWIGYSEVEILTMMSTSPVAYGQSVNLLVDWDMSEDSPRAIKAISMGSLDNYQEAKDNLRELIDHTVPIYDRTMDAIEHIRRDVVGGQVVSVWVDGSEIVVDYEDSGRESGVVRFSVSNGELVPEWVLVTMEKKYKIKRKLSSD